MPLLDLGGIAMGVRIQGSFVSVLIRQVQYEDGVKVAGLGASIGFPGYRV